MTNPALRKNTQLDSSNFISQAEAGTLPAVSFLKPADDDGHPGYSSLYAFENFVARAIAAVQSNTAEWKSTGDNLPNPTPEAYVPQDRPAIGDLMTMFNFRHPYYAKVQLP
jgi:Phosphoesterase family